MADDTTHIRPDHLCGYLFGLALVVTSLLYALRAHPELCATARGLTLVMIAVTAIAHLHHRVMRQLDNQQVAAGQLLGEVARARAAMQDGREELKEAGEQVRRVEEWIRQVGHDRLAIANLQKTLTGFGAAVDRVGRDLTSLDGQLAADAARRISLRIVHPPG